MFSYFKLGKSKHVKDEYELGELKNVKVGDKFILKKNCIYNGDIEDVRFGEGTIFILANIKELNYKKEKLARQHGDWSKVLGLRTVTDYPEYTQFTFFKYLEGDKIPEKFDIDSYYCVKNNTPIVVFKTHTTCSSRLGNTILPNLSGLANFFNSNNMMKHKEELTQEEKYIIETVNKIADNGFIKNTNLYTDLQNNIKSYVGIPEAAPVPGPVSAPEPAPVSAPVPAPVSAPAENTKAVSAKSDKAVSMEIANSASAKRANAASAKRAKSASAERASGGNMKSKTRKLKNRRNRKSKSMRRLY